MQPRTEGPQRCLHFGLSTVPAGRVMMYHDDEGNVVHHFDVPGRHSRLTITAEAIVERLPVASLPQSLDANAWETLDEAALSGVLWDFLNPSTFARPTHHLVQLGTELALTRAADPLTTMRLLSADIHARFAYVPQSTRVDSPIDEALAARRGVCQDFAHIFIALARHIGVPCRYVSGYLFQESAAQNGTLSGATHAWTEAWLPGLGWIGFDPTNDGLTGDGHIRVAIGRDYADVPPTRGVFKGTSAVKSELSVAVNVGETDWMRSGEAMPFVPWMSRDASAPLPDPAGVDQ
jgi:transglutaminase-like putative cysteine protease